MPAGAGFDDALQPVDVIRLFTTTRPNAVADGRFQLLVGFGVTVQQHSRARPAPAASAVTIFSPPATSSSRPSWLISRWNGGARGMLRRNATSVGATGCAQQAAGTARTARNCVRRPPCDQGYELFGEIVEAAPTNDSVLSAPTDEPGGEEIR